MAKLQLLQRPLATMLAAATATTTMMLWTWAEGRNILTALQAAALAAAVDVALAAVAVAAVHLVVVQEAWAVGCPAAWEAWAEWRTFSKAWAGWVAATH